MARVREKIIHSCIGAAQLIDHYYYHVIGKIKFQSFVATEANKMGFYYHQPQHISRHPHARMNLIISINKKSMRHINLRVVFCIFFYTAADDNFLNGFFFGSENLR